VQWMGMWLALPVTSVGPRAVVYKKKGSRSADHSKLKCHAALIFMGATWQRLPGLA